jgi:hypothetical protein
MKTNERKSKKKMTMKIGKMKTQGREKSPKGD